LSDGIPSDGVVERIELSADFRRQSARLRRALISVAALLATLSTATVLVGWLLSSKISHLTEESRVAGAKVATLTDERGRTAAALEESKATLSKTRAEVDQAEADNARAQATARQSAEAATAAKREREQAERAAKDARATATVTALVARSTAAATTDPDLAVRLALDAVEKREIPETVAALRLAMAEYVPHASYQADAATDEISFSADGKSILVTRDGRTGFAVFHPPSPVLEFVDAPTARALYGVQPSAPLVAGGDWVPPNGSPIRAEAPIPGQSEVIVWAEDGAVYLTKGPTMLQQAKLKPAGGACSDPDEPCLPPMPIAPRFPSTSPPIAIGRNIFALVGSDVVEVRRRKDLKLLCTKRMYRGAEPAPITGFGFRADGEALALASAAGVEILSDDSPCDGSITITTDRVDGMSFAPRGNVLLTWGAYSATVWDSRLPSKRLMMKGLKAAINRAVFDGTGCQIAANSSRPSPTVHLWNICQHDWEPPHKLPGNRTLRYLKAGFDRTGKVVLINDSDEAIAWRWAESTEAVLLPHGRTNHSAAVVLERQGELFALDRDGLRLFDSQALRFRETPHLSPGDPPRVPAMATPLRNLSGIRWRDDGQFVATTSDDGLDIWDGKAGTLVRHLDHAADTRALATAFMHGRNVVSIWTDGVVRTDACVGCRQPAPLIALAKACLIRPDCAATDQSSAALSSDVQRE
jgi:hypothetical protein